MLPRMSPDLVSYDHADGIATITLDDGKVNALSSAMLAAVGGALDRAEADGAVVVLTGRATTFSAGFDLRSEDWPTMLADGARLAERLLAFPAPVVAACNGHALAMGAFVLLSVDVRVGAGGDFKLGLNEVAIGLTVPYFALALARHRLTRPAYDRCTITGAILDPAAAVAAGFLDALAEPADVLPTALATARELTRIDRAAHHATKLRVREAALAGVRDGLDRLATGEPAAW